MSATCVAAAAASLLGLGGLNAGGALAIGPVNLIPVAAGYDRAARRDLNSPTPQSAQLEAARAHSRAAIGEYPYDTEAWLRLSYIDAAQHGHLTPVGLAALRRSYDLIAVDPDIALWRIQFALENSQTLSRPLRAMVKQEVAAAWTVPSLRPRLSELQTQLQNPAGRLSLALWLLTLRSGDAK